MRTVKDELEERITAAMQQYASGAGICPAIVRPASDPSFGDYQSNGIMGLAKKIKANPVNTAHDVLKNLDLSDICEPPEVAGPGFINLRLKPEFLAERLLEINKSSASLGIDKAAEPKTIVVDFSSPNIAKQMHVGHLRSTIIGDCICRILEFLGHKVIRQNHIGDWGTNFGMVILGLWHICMSEKRIDEKPYYQTKLEELKTSPIDEKRLKDIRDRHEEDWREDSDKELGDGKKFFNPFLEKIKERNNEDYIWPKILLAYQYVNLLEESVTGVGLKIPTRKKKKFHKEDEKTFDYVLIPYESLSRHITACYLQNIDDEDNEQEKDAWKYVRGLTLEYCNGIYERLGVTLTPADVRGESFYNEMLQDIVKYLEHEGVAEESDGAVCVFPEGFKTKEGTPLPFIIQKSDGAYLYATTDLAALRYRIHELNANHIIYVTDARQALHFRMLAATVLMADWLRDDTRISHVMFGSVLGDDGTPLKTRAGENVKLKELLDEATERAKAIVDEKNPELSQDKKEQIAKAVGIGAVKYADYSNNRTSDYVFSFDKMLAMDGNTAPYMQYAYARIKSIERKAQTKKVDIEDELKEIEALDLTEPAELDLAKYLIRYGEAIQAAIADYRPNYLTAYLYELAQKFSAFYTNCPVLKAEPAKRPTRLLLCDLTARTIKHGLSELLGIEVVEQM